MNRACHEFFPQRRWCHENVDPDGALVTLAIAMRFRDEDGAQPP